MTFLLLIFAFVCLRTEAQSIAPPYQIADLSNMVPPLYPPLALPVTGTISWSNSIARSNAFSVLYHSEDLRSWTPIWSNTMQLQMSVQIVDSNTNDFFRVANHVPGL